MEIKEGEDHPQWMPLTRIEEPFRSRLVEIYPGSPVSHKQPKHFDLFARDGKDIWISGQIPRFNHEIRHVGIVGKDISIVEAREAARLCTANFLSILAAACCGDLSKVDRIVRITGYIRCTEEFGDQADVIDAASEMLEMLFGERGRHARSAIGVRSLPSCASVELEGIVRLKQVTDTG
jgi:enamine deaminase RidA (YjgF/YER057c/UK114 family)